MKIKPLPGADLPNHYVVFYADTDTKMTYDDWELDDVIKDIGKEYQEVFIFAKNIEYGTGRLLCRKKEGCIKFKACVPTIKG